ncbi:hypothetical protein [Pedobacter sp.]
MMTNEINKTTGLIHNEGNFVGSAMLFPFNGKLFAITAGHNLYGKKFTDVPNLDNLTVSDHTKITHPIRCILGDSAFAKSHDIVLLELDCKTEISNFLPIRFCTIPRNPKHSLMFRGKYKNTEDPVTHRAITYTSTTTQSEHKFLCQIEKSLLMNHNYSSGSDWLGGWSGSALFIDNHKELICAGVMIEIPNKGNDGQLLFVNTLPLKDLGFESDIINAENLDFDKALNAASLAAIIDSFDEKTIREWEENNKNSEQLKFLNRKLNEIYPPDNIVKNKNKIIKQLLAGKAYLTTELSKNEQIFKQYNSAYKVYNLDSKEFYVNTKAEALTQLSGIKSSYEEYLIGNLGDDLPTADIKLLAIYGVSEWIADCSLDFLKYE